MLSAEYMEKIGELAKWYDLKLHVDGARLLNASAVSAPSPDLLSLFSPLSFLSLLTLFPLLTLLTLALMRGSSLTCVSPLTRDSSLTCVSPLTCGCIQALKVAPDVLVKNADSVSVSFPLAPVSSQMLCVRKHCILSPPLNPAPTAAWVQEHAQQPRIPKPLHSIADSF